MIGHCQMVQLQAKSVTSRVKSFCPVSPLGVAIPKSFARKRPSPTENISRKSACPDRDYPLMLCIIISGGGSIRRGDKVPSFGPCLPLHIVEAISLHPEKVIIALAKKTRAVPPKIAKLRYQDIWLDYRMRLINRGRCGRKRMSLLKPSRS